MRFAPDQIKCLRAWTHAFWMGYAFQFLPAAQAGDPYPFPSPTSADDPCPIACFADPGTDSCPANFPVPAPSSSPTIDVENDFKIKAVPVDNLQTADLPMAYTACANTVRMRQMNACMRKWPNVAWTLKFPAGLVKYCSPRWLQGLKYVKLQGAPVPEASPSGTPSPAPSTWLQNVRTARDAPFKNSTWMSPLFVNQDYFKDDAHDPMPSSTSTPSSALVEEGTFVGGDLIKSADAGSLCVTLQQGDGIYKPRDWVLIHGYNGGSQGWPPSERYFEVAQIDDHPLHDCGLLGLPLKRPLTYSYNEKWPDVYFQAGTHLPLGKPRILNLYRATGSEPGKFQLAQHVEINDVRFASSPFYQACTYPCSKPSVDKGNSIGLSGAVYTGSARSLTFNRVVIGFFDPAENAHIVVNDSRIETGEFDKMVEKLELNRSVVGTTAAMSSGGKDGISSTINGISNSPSTHHLSFSGPHCEIRRPAFYNAQDTTFDGCDFYPNPDAAIKIGEYVAPAMGMPGTYTFKNPVIHVGADKPVQFLAIPNRYPVGTNIANTPTPGRIEVPFPGKDCDHGLDDAQTGSKVMSVLNALMSWQASNPAIPTDLGFRGSILRPTDPKLSDQEYAVTSIECEPSVPDPHASPVTVIKIRSTVESAPVPTPSPGQGFSANHVLKLEIDYPQVVVDLPNGETKPYTGSDFTLGKLTNVDALTLTLPPPPTVLQATPVVTDTGARHVDLSWSASVPLVTGVAPYTVYIPYMRHCASSTKCPDSPAPASVADLTQKNGWSQRADLKTTALSTTVPNVVNANQSYCFVVTAAVDGSASPQTQGQPSPMTCIKMK